MEPDVADPHLVVNLDKVTVAFAGTYDGGIHIDPAHHFLVDLEGLNVKLRNAKTQAPVLDEKWLKVDVGADVALSPDATSINIPMLSVTSADHLMDVDTAGKPVNIVLNNGGAPSGTGTIHFNGNLASWMTMLASLSPPKPVETVATVAGVQAAPVQASVTKFDSGTLDGTLVLADALWRDDHHRRHQCDESQRQRNTRRASTCCCRIRRPRFT